MLNICLQDLPLRADCNGIVPMWHPMNHNDECWLRHLWEVTSSVVAEVLSQISCRSLIGSPFLLPLLNYAGKLLSTYMNPLSTNPLGFIKIVQLQPIPRSHQKICIASVQAQCSMLRLFEMVLPPHNTLMHFLNLHSHPYIVPLIEITIVGLPRPFGKLLKGESNVQQVNSGLAFGTTQVRRMIYFITSVISDIETLQQWGQIASTGNTSSASFCSRQRSIC